MITIKTFTYFIGITIVISTFCLFLYSFLPHLIENDQWERLKGFDMSEEELLKKFQEHEAYIAFYERFPNAQENFRYYNDRGGDIQVGEVNFEKNNTLTMRLNYNEHEDYIDVNVQCDTNEVGYSDFRVDNLFAVDYIKETNCLEIESIISDTNFGLIKEPSPPINLSGSSFCGSDTIYQDGVCLIIVD